MGIVYHKSNEKYDCPNRFLGYIQRFEALQATIAACSGARGKKRLEICVSCKNQISNASSREWVNELSPV